MGRSGLRTETYCADCGLRLDTCDLSGCNSCPQCHGQNWETVPQTARSIDDELAAKKKEAKPPLGLVPASAIEAIAWAMEYGARKHGRDDWRKGFPFTERLNSALRHIFSYLEGEDIDPESGVPNLDLAMTQLVFVKEYTVTHPECDDRYATVARQEARDAIIKRRLDEMR